ncbi:MAG: proprotein convertase P-domain-containing protein [Phycisphaerales bacterium]|nr:proprotein convertase P-domain-containing protein [Phycisphaerales bacterium]
MTCFNGPVLVLATAFLATSNAHGSELHACSGSGFPIPDGSASGSVAPLVIGQSEDPLVVVGARLELEIEHPWVGDLVVELTSPSGAVTLALIDRAGQVPYGFPGPFGCGGDDMLVSLEDEAALSIEEVCTTTGTPVFSGVLRPQQSLAGFNGVDPVGTWSLRLIDVQSGDAGSFVSACLRLDVETDCDRDGVPDDCTSCAGDLDGDGTVDGSDLSAMLGSWGTSNQSADIDGDGVVGGSDLSVLLGNWGACP